MCRDVQKQKALVKNESLQTILSGEKLHYVIITIRATFGTVIVP